MKKNQLREKIKSLCCNSVVRSQLELRHKAVDREIYYCGKCGKKCRIKYIG